MAAGSSAAPALAADRIYKTREVAELEGVTKRTLYEHIRADKFPRPDFPHQGHGAPDRWYGSTILKARADRQARQQAGV